MTVGTLSNGKVRIIGACCFRLREWSDIPPAYGLQWIWFHPYARHRGHLTKAWPYFMKRLGLIVPEGPFSPPMEAFLKKNCYYPFHEDAMPELPERPPAAD